MAKQRASVAEFIANGKSSGDEGARIEFAEFYDGSGVGGGVWEFTGNIETPNSPQTPNDRLTSPATFRTRDGKVYEIVEETINDWRKYGVVEAAIESTNRVTSDILRNSTTTLSPRGDGFIDLDYTLDVPDGSTVLSLTPGLAGVTLRNSKFDGGTVESGGSRNRTAHMINFTSVNSEGINIINSEITGYTFPLLKSNTTLGNQSRFIVNGSYFHDNYGVDILFNSPAANSSMKDIVVTNNIIGDNLAGSIGGFSHRISMAGEVDNFVVSNNAVSGVGNEFWRAEEHAKNGVISSNVAQIGDRHGIEVTDNNIGGVAFTPSQLVISNNALEGKGVLGTRGLHFSFDASGVHSIERSVISGNVLSNWDDGIRLSRKGYYNIMLGNVAFDCNTAIRSQEPSLALRDTLIIDTPVAFNSGNGGIYGNIHLRDTTQSTPLFSALSTSQGNPAATTGWTYESSSFTIPSQSNTYIPIIELGVSCNLDLVIYFGRDTGNNYTFIRGVLDWDGTTLTFTENHRASSGNVILSSSSPFRENSGNLEVNVFSAVPAEYDSCRLQIETNGLHVL